MDSLSKVDGISREAVVEIVIILESILIPSAPWTVFKDDPPMGIETDDRRDEVLLVSDPDPVAVVPAVAEAAAAAAAAALAAAAAETRFLRVACFF